MVTPGYFLEIVQSESPDCTVWTFAPLATVFEDLDTLLLELLSAT